jgi:hypothetical protein
MRSAGGVSDDRTTRPSGIAAKDPRPTLERRESHPVVLLVLRQDSEKNGRADCSREWPPDIGAESARRVGPVSRHQVELDSGMLRHGINRAGSGLHPPASLLQTLASTSRTCIVVFGAEPQTHRWGYGEGALRHAYGGEKAGEDCQPFGNSPIAAGFHGLSRIG